MKTNFSRRKIFLTLLLSTAILLGILSLAGIQRSLGFISQANLLLLLSAFIASNLGIVINSRIWRDTLNRLGLQLTSSEALKLVFANAFINNITPLGHAGGEPFIVYHLASRTEEDSGRIFSGVLVADIINFTPSITSGVIGAVLTSAQTRSLLGLAAVKKKIGEESGKFKEGLKILSMNRKKLLSLSAFSHLSIITDIAAIWLLALSLGLKISAVPLLLILPLARIANYTPTPGGTGPYELALTGLLSYFYGIPVFQAASISIIYRALTYYFGIIAGAYSITVLNFEN